MKILHIDSSLRSTGSKTRELSKHLIDGLKKKDSSLEVTYLDLSKNTPNHPNEAHSIANYTLSANRTDENKKALAESDHYISLLKDADLYVFGVPMYNFSIPSTLKAFIDNIVRINETFSFDGSNFSGLLNGKKAIFCTSRGGVYRDGPLKEADLQEPYLRTVFGFMGVTDCQFINADGQDFGPPNWAETAFNESLKEIDKLTTAFS